MSRELVALGRLRPYDEGPLLLQGCQALTLQVADRPRRQVISIAQLINPAGLYPEILTDARTFTLAKMFAQVYQGLHRPNDTPTIEETS